MPADPQRVKELFVAALDLPEAPARQAFLERACGSDAELRQRLEVLLRAHDDPASILNQPLAEVVSADSGTTGPGSSMPEPRTGDAPCAAERAGTLIAGRYKLVEEIGEGGMGRVWLAQQQEPVKRLVAVKLIKPGMDTGQVLARFEAERQALALMDHPNIARVFDAGTIAGEPGRAPGGSSAGRPYFVMELVKGLPVTVYCDHNQLTPRQRLELFVGVCQAIQHAHTKGIIHRDVKPSNVLIAPYDGKPVVKVIDFGIAKALGQQLTERTLVTGFGAVVGTLEYMSPEQAELNNQDIDTRSDVYSLGVLLYELLTGTTPLERKRLKEMPLLEVLRAIREEEPPRPSTRLSEAKDTLPAISAQRQMEPAQLTRLVRGELDWVVMKALDKERQRRYESASTFAADVQRYLNDEAVLACPPSAWYRFRKFARRNVAAMTTAGLVAAALVLGTVVSCYFAYQATQRAGEAVAEKTRAHKSLRRSLEALGLVNEVDEKQLALEPHQEQLRAELMHKVLAFYEQFLRENAEDPSMRRETGLAYRRAGELHRYLGDHARAEQSFEKGIELLQALAEELPGEPAYRKELASTLLSRARLLWHLGRVREGEQDGRRSAALQEELVADHPGEPDYRHDLVRTYNTLGVLLNADGRFNAAEKAYRQALDFGAHLPARAEYRKTTAQCLGNLAVVLERTGRTKEAEPVYREAIRAGETVLQELKQEREFQGVLANLHNNLGYLLQETSRPEKAEEEYGYALKLSRKLVEDFPGVPRYQFEMANHQNTLAVLWWKTDRTRRAEKLFTQTCDLLRKLADDFPKVPAYPCVLAGTLNNLGKLLMEQTEHARARTVLEEAVAYQQKALAIHPKNPEYRQSLGNHYANLAAALRDLKAPTAEVDAAYRRATAHKRKLAEDYPKVPHYQGGLAAHLNDHARVLLGRGEPDKARRLLEEAITYQRKALASDPGNRTYRASLRHQYANLGEALLRLGQPRQAEEARRQALAIGKELDHDFPGVRDYQVMVADDYLALANLLGDGPQAEHKEKAYRQALTRWQRLANDYPKVAAYRSQLAKVLHNLAILLARQGDLARARPLLQEAIGHQRAAYEARPEQYRRDLLQHYQMLIKVLLDSRDHAAAAKEALAMVGVSGGAWKPCYEAAGSLQRCQFLAAKDPGLTAARRRELAQTYTRQLWALQAEAAKRNPDHPEVQRQLAVFLTTCPDPKYRDAARAVELAGRAVQRDPEKGAYWGVLGMAQYRAGNWSEAVSALEKARDLTEARDTQFFLAMAYWRQGEKKRARQRYVEAIRWMQQHAPGDAWVGSFRAEAAKLMGLKND
jgi:serine/threonine protein kinase/uncharacterized protein HemY